MKSKIYMIFLIIIFFNIYFFNKSIKYASNKNDLYKVRLCCLVLTSPKFFDNRTRAVYKTWGSRCDKLLFISELSSNISTDLPIAPINYLKSGYQYLSLKSILGFKYVYEYELNNYDWFLKADDDTYIIIENLKKFLNKQNSLSPVTFGYNFRVGYQSGGAGYVLSKESVRRLNEGINENNLNCQIKIHISEDMLIGDCLHSKGVYQGKSTDHLNRQRFHPLSYYDHFYGNIPQWFKDFSQDRVIKTGIDCCSDTSISFHYVNPDMMYLIDAMLYRFQINL